MGASGISSSAAWRRTLWYKYKITEDAWGISVVFVWVKPGSGEMKKITVRMCVIY